VANLEMIEPRAAGGRDSGEWAIPAFNRTRLIRAGNFNENTSTGNPIELVVNLVSDRLDPRGVAKRVRLHRSKAYEIEKDGSIHEIGRPVASPSVAIRMLPCPKCGTQPKSIVSKRGLGAYSAKPVTASDGLA
jgi:hypothetical protein